MKVSIPWGVVVPLFVPADEESASTAIGFIMKGLYCMITSFVFSAPSFLCSLWLKEDVKSQTNSH